MSESTIPIKHEPGPGEWQCAMCGGIFEKATDPEAQAAAKAEFAENFPDAVLDEGSAVCDLCWEIVRPDKPVFENPGLRDASAEFILRGKGEDPVPLKSSDEVFNLKGCPSCEGRGWFLINPFATGGTNGVGGLGNMCRCLTCADAKAFFDKYGTLPTPLAHLMPKATDAQA